MLGGLRTTVLAIAIAATRGDAQLRPDSALEIRVDIARRQIVVFGPQGDTLRVMPAAVGSGGVLRAGDTVWTFNTPRGVATVIRKEENPLWIPPDWHYVEVARAEQLRLDRLQFGEEKLLRNGTRLVMRGSVAGVLKELEFRPLPTDEHIIFDSTLFIPPFGAKNRFVAGVLGAYRLALSNGVAIHGTPDGESIGKAVTHGCIRLRDADVTWLYQNVPVGARVVIE